jgi:hypothetical protein
MTCYCIYDTHNFLIVMNLLTINKGSVDSLIKLLYEVKSSIAISMFLFLSRSSNVSIAFDLKVLDIFAISSKLDINSLYSYTFGIC